MLIFNFLFRNIVSKVNLDRFMSLKTPYTIKRLSWYCITFNHQTMKSFHSKVMPRCYTKGPEKVVTENWGICRYIHQWEAEKDQSFGCGGSSSCVFSKYCHITATRWEYSEGSEWTSNNALNVWTMFTGYNQSSVPFSTITDVPHCSPLPLHALVKVMYSRPS